MTLQKYFLYFKLVYEKLRSYHQCSAIQCVGFHLRKRCEMEEIGMNIKLSCATSFPLMIPRNLLPNPLHLRTQGGGLQHFHGFAHGQ